MIDFGSAEPWNGTESLTKKEPLTFCCNGLYASVPYLLGYRPTCLTDSESLFYLFSYLEEIEFGWIDNSSLYSIALKKAKFLSSSDLTCLFSTSESASIQKAASYCTSHPFIDGFFMGADLIITSNMDESSGEEESNSMDELSKKEN